nr:retrovirus-related Pol polyprotein from transposon TNT 1-94 [Tanacetum cinerariifolium]
MILALMAKAFKLNYSTPTNNNERISSNPHNRQIAQPGMNMGQDRQMQMVGSNGENQFRQHAVQNVGNLNGYKNVQNIENQNLNGNGNLVAARAEGNATRHNGNQIRCYNYRGVGHFSRNCTVRPGRRDATYLQTQLLIAQKEEAGIQLQDEEFDLMAAAADLDEIEEVDANCILMANLQQASTSSTQTDKAPIYDSDGSAEPNLLKNLNLLQKKLMNLLLSTRHLELEIKRLLRAVVSQNIMSAEQNNSVGETSNLQTELQRTKERFENYIIKKENEYAKLWNDWYKKCEECKFNKISYDKAYNDMQQKIERLQAQLGDIKGKSKDTSCVSDIHNPLSQKLENENVELEFQDGKTNALSKPITSNSTPTPQESKVVKNAKVIAPGMFRINPFKTSSEEKHVPNKVRASVRTKPIIVSQPPVFTKKVVNSDSNETKGKCFNQSKANETTTKVKKTKKVGFIERLATPRLSKPRSFLRVYFVEGLGHNLFSIGQFCDSDLEVAFRRNACFIRNLEGVDLLSGNHTINLYTINLHEMAYASPICLMARVFSTKSWLWHQRLSHLNFDTTNDLAKNDLVSEFRNQVLKEYFDSVSISHQVSFICTPQQNRVVEQRNRTLVEVARTMLIFSHAPLFLWAEAIATACFTQNRSIVHRRFNKNPYELISGRKLDISFLHVFGALCYTKNDRKDIGKLGAKGDIGFFIGYSVDSCAFRVYNRRTKKIIETMNVSFNELSAMAFEQHNSKPKLQSKTSRQISSGLDLTYAPSTITTQQPTKGELDLLFEAMYDDYIGSQPSATSRSVLAAQEHQICQSSTTSTSIADAAPTPTNLSSQATNFPISSQDVDRLNLQQQQAHQQGNQASLQSKTVADNVPNAMFDANTFFKRVDVWVLVPAPYNISPLTLKWIFKNKNDEENTVIQNKSCLVVRGYRQEEGLDFKESFASVARMEAIRIFLAYAAHKSFTVFQIDVKTAFLHGTIDPTLFIRRFDYDILVAKPTEKHLKEVKRIFRYLRGTVNTGLWYMKDSGFELTGFLDANNARCKDTFKSTSGGAQFLGKKLLTDYGFHFIKIPIYYDSKSAIAISCNPIQHSRTKHIDVRYHFIKEHIEKGTIELYFVKTNYQLTDIFTKALPVDRFNYLVRRLGMRNLFPQELDRLAKSQVNIKQLCGRIRRQRYILISAESRFKTPWSIVKDKYMMKAQVHVSKSFAISDVQALLQKEQYRQDC